MIVTREHLERVAPAFRDQLKKNGSVRVASLLEKKLFLSEREAVAGAAALLIYEDLDDITLGQNFRKAIEAADGRKFEAGS